MRIVCFGQQNWDYCWTAKQQLMTRLVRRGHSVLYVDPAADEQVAPAERYRALRPVATRCGLREVRPGLLVFTYPHAPLLRYRINAWRRPYVLRALARDLGFVDGPVIVLHPGAAALVPAVRPRGVIYFGVDDVTAFPNMTPAHCRDLEAQEAELLRQADRAIAVSPRLQARFARLCPRCDLLPNAADLEHFGPAHLARVPPHPQIAALRGPRIGFVGQVDERLDQRLVVALARHRSDWHIVLAGRVKPGVDVSALAAEPNVRLLGYQPYERLPGILREIDVCVVPYRLNDLTHACNPLKLFEYLATGRPVVSTALEGIGPCAEVIDIARTDGEFLDAVARAAAAPHRGRDARLAFATRHGWDARVDVLEQHLLEVLRSRPPVPRRSPHKTDLLYASSEPSRRARWGLRAAGAIGAIRQTVRSITRRAAGRAPAVRRILVARRCRLGDLIVFLPALHALRRRYPSARLVLGIPSDSGSVPLRSMLPVDEVRPLEVPDATLIRRARRGVRLLLERFDLVVSGAGFFLLRDALCAGAPIRLGLDDGHPWQRFNSARIELEPALHETDNNLRLLEAAGVHAEGDERVPTIGPIGPEARDAADAALRACGIAPDTPYILVHPGAQKPSRRWPPDRFAALLQRVLECRPAVHAVATGVSGEAGLVADILGALPDTIRSRAHNLAGRTSIATLVALMQRSRAVVCNDTGSMHLARAGGAPLLALLGPENHRRWGPHPLGPGPAVALRHDVPCAPCVRWNCEDLFCLNLLTVQQAHDALDALLDGPPPAAGAGMQPLVLHLQRHTWETIADAGLPVPIVSVALIARRDAVHARAADDAGAIAASLAMIARQAYPRVEVVLARSAADRVFGGRSREIAHLPNVRVAAAMAGTWRALLCAASGEFVAPLAPGYGWENSKLSEDVALLVRQPDTAAVFCALAGEPDRRGPGIGSATYRRAAIASALNSPDAPADTALDVFSNPAVGPVARLDALLAWTPVGGSEAPA